MIWRVILLWLAGITIVAADLAHLSSVDLAQDSFALQQRDTNNNPQVTYTRGPDLSLTLGGAGGIGGMLARTDASGSAYYHADGSGNITALIDSSEYIAARYEYVGFGRELGQWGRLSEANRYRFSSKEIVPHMGLYYYGRRYYDYDLQRWLNRDPLGEAGGLNLYQFTGNDPVNHIDPWGNQSTGTETVDADATPPEPTPILYPRGTMPDAERIRELNYLENRPPSETHLSAPESEERESQKKEPQGGVYGLRDPECGQIMRTGRSKDLERRKDEHENDPRFKTFEFVPLYKTDEYAEQRGLEQIVHNQYQAPFDYINPISDVNANYDSYISAAQNYLKAK